MSASAYPHDSFDLARFASRVDRRGADQCWPWTGATFDERGYGVFTLHRRAVRAHRFMWYATNLAEIPDGMVVRHKCDNPRCVNPSHLLLGTQQDNVDDRQARGRTARGERVATAKLNVEQVRHIRADKRGARVLARELGVARSLVQRIRQGRHWTHV